MKKGSFNTHVSGSFFCTFLSGGKFGIGDVRKSNFKKCVKFLKLL